MKRKGHAQERRRYLAAVGISAFLWGIIGILSVLIGPFGLFLQADPRTPEFIVFMGDPPRKIVNETPIRPLDPPPAPLPEITPTTARNEAPESPAAAAEPTPDAETEAARPVPADAAIPASGAGTGEKAAVPTGDDAASREGGISASSLAILNEAIKRNLKYPPQARKRGIQGKVEIEIAVNETGALTACELTGPSGSGLLDEAALKLLRGLFPLSGTAGEGFRTRIAIEYRLN